MKMIIIISNDKYNNDNYNTLFDELDNNGQPLAVCGIAHILCILVMNSYNTDIFFSNYYNLQSVYFEL